MKDIPLLTAKDVELRVAQISGNVNKAYVSLLVYKDARVDMRILDEVFGQNNWQRHHKMIGDNLYCTISVWDEEKGIWIEKEDVGTESFTEAQKGQASDSFKRAGFNWGIGRELYNAPRIFFPLQTGEAKEGRNGKLQTYEKFTVSEMVYDKQKQEFTTFTVVDKSGNVRFSLGKHHAEALNNSNERYADHVRLPDGKTCEVLAANGKWYNVEALPTDNLLRIVDKPEFTKAHSAITAVINSREVKQ